MNSFLKQYCFDFNILYKYKAVCRETYIDENHKQKITARVLPAVTVIFRLFSGVLFKSIKLLTKLFRKLVAELGIEFLDAFSVLSPKLLINVKN